MTELLINLGMSLGGLIIATLWAVRKHVIGGSFSWAKFKSENILRWFWTGCLCAVIAVMTYISIDFSEAIQKLTGIDFDGSPGAFAVLAVGLFGLTKKRKGVETPQNDNA